MEVTYLTSPSGELLGKLQLLTAGGGPNRETLAETLCLAAGHLLLSDLAVNLRLVARHSDLPGFLYVFLGVFHVFPVFLFFPCFSMFFLFFPCFSMFFFVFFPCFSMFFCFFHVFPCFFVFSMFFHVFLFKCFS